MEMAAILASAPTLSWTPRLHSPSSVAVRDVAAVTATDAARSEAGSTGTTSRDRAADRAAELADQERELLRRLTAEDFAAIQEQLGLRLNPELDDQATADEVIELDARPGFSKILADGVVTISEYLDWVNEAGGQPG